MNFRGGDIIQPIHYCLSFHTQKICIIGGGGGRYGVEGNLRFSAR